MSAEKVIGFDMDGVLLDQTQTMREWAMHTFPLKADSIDYLGASATTCWELERWMGLSKEQVGEYWKFATKCQSRPMTATPYYLRRFKDAGWQVHVISHRTPDSPFAGRGRKDLTLWFEGLFDSLTYTTTTDGKLPVIQEKGCQAFLEDKFETAYMLGKAGVKSYLIDRPYNRGLDLDVPYKRVFGMQEFCEDFGV